MKKGEDRLQGILAEYNALRNEMLQKHQHHLQLYSFLIAALGIGVAYVIQQQAYDLLLGIPLVTSALAFRHLWEQSVIVSLGNYIREEIERKRIPEVLGHREGSKTGNYDRYWVAWEHYWREHYHPDGYYKFAIQILYVLLPFGGALVYLGVLEFNPDVFGVILKTNVPKELRIATVSVYPPLAFFLSWKLWTI